MLLAIDIGNSNISVGLFDREKTLKFLASIDTDLSLIHICKDFRVLSGRSHLP